MNSFTACNRQRDLSVNRSFLVGGLVVGFLVGGFDVGFLVGGLVVGFLVGGFVVGFLVGGFVVGFLVGGFVVGFLVGGFVVGFLVGGFVVGFLVGGFVVGFLVGGFVDGFGVLGHAVGLLLLNRHSCLSIHFAWYDILVYTPGASAIPQPRSLPKDVIPTCTSLRASVPRTRSGPPESPPHVSFVPPAHSI